ncbi:unnamed protein product, partial [Meganyctiphanes norvegica]
LLSHIESTLESVKDDVAAIKTVTKKIEFEKIQSITPVLTENECPESDGFFRSAGGNQCMKAFVDRSLTWDDAGSHCRSQGLALSEPHDAVGLQKYLVERFGIGKFYWVGGRRSGSGSTFKWTRGGGELPSTSPLWWKGQPKTGEHHCLAFGLNVSNFVKDPKRPYWNWKCTATYIPICEVNRDNDNINGTITRE